MRIVASMLVAVAALALAATAPAAGPLTAAKYRAKANASCTRLANRAAALPSIGSPEQIPTWLAAYIPLASATVGEIRALQPPVGLAGLHRRILANLTRQIARSKALLSSVRAGKVKPEVVATDPELTRLSDQEMALWKRIGARVCGGP